MSTVQLYGFEDAEGNEDSFTTFSAIEAKAYAEEHRLKWISFEYVYSDHEVVMDFTPQEEDEEG